MTVNPEMTQTPSLLRGLVVMNSLGRAMSGMNRSLSLTVPFLESHDMWLHFITSQSPKRLVRSLGRVFIREWRGQVFDFVLYNGLGALEGDASYPVAALARRLNLPILIYWHEMSMIFEELSQSNPVGIERADRIARMPGVNHLCASQASAKAIAERYGLSALPEVVYEAAAIPSPFDQPVNPVADPPVVVNAASIQFKKGTDLFVDIAIKVCQQHPSVEFVWLGGGRQYGDSLEKITVAGLQNRILFPGFMNSPYMFVRRASVFFLSSRQDTFPLALLEAMSLGRRIVAFHAGGAPEALDGLGTLIEPFDTDAAANEILRLLEEPAGLNLAARERYLQNFTPEHQAARLNKAIRQVLGRK